MSIRVPEGFRLAGMHCGLKRNKTREDLTLVVSDLPAAAAGVYTSNLVFAAPVELDRSRTPGSGFRAVAINSGNANACTGERGLADAREMARLAAATCGAGAEQALVMSTGIIGEFLPIEKIRAGLATIAGQLGRDEDSLVAAARGMMTTDTVHKLSGRSIALSGRTIHLAGMCKGAAMIAPRMGTMLGLVLTDAPLSPAAAQQSLSAVIDDTFNCISIDGHMSTNDTVLLLANGAAGGAPLEGADLAAFQTALHEVCGELARAIPADGEGAKHLVTIDVTGCATRESARQIARTVADSALVKTAIAGADPNWGRIVSAAGYAGVPFDPTKVELHVNGFLLYQHAAPTSFDAAAVSASMRDHRDTQIVLNFSEGSERIHFWTTDLTEEYVRLNADYHT
ncbi:MAG TPA: bifunctional glutamate N-acetyltransferase/amino-acid acetyltransferase ArgJ [Pirellulales bacterium]|jgi:glutamate N-acetyltransferase/amino-acid N-acetyltransferase|nr:bifunctional glutamate N-acetyltransferase/amino-acid acetyltransferase ArgJ [Pirellulales bacterium]